MHRYTSTLILALLACSNGGGQPTGSEGPGSSTPVPVSKAPFTVEPMAEFDEPWAMTFLPGGSYLLVTEKPGRLKLFQLSSGSLLDVKGVPDVAYGGQGGLGDVIVAPGDDGTDTAYTIYLSWAEAGQGNTRGAAVARATLAVDEMGEGTAELENLQIIWRQDPKVTGGGHFGHRLAFSPDGQFLFISSGERQKFDPAQDMNANLGKIVRLRPDGSVPPDNPFAQKGGVTAQIWSLGHRNPLGIGFDAQGRLWAHEMGPRGGDEVNLVERGANYGWPIVSNGDHYSGEPIPDHPTRPEFKAPEVWWNPAISPAGLTIYTGDRFPQWKGSMLLGALSGQALIRVALDGETARKADHWDMDERIREIEQGPDGALWILEDGSGGRLLRLEPR